MKNEELTMGERITSMIALLINNQNEKNPRGHGNAWFFHSPVAQQQADRLARKLLRETEPIVHDGHVIVRRESLATAHLATAMQEEFSEQWEASFSLAEEHLPMWVGSLVTAAIPLVDWRAIAGFYIQHAANEINEPVQSNEAQNEGVHNEH